MDLNTIELIRQHLEQNNAKIIDEEVSLNSDFYTYQREVQNPTLSMSSILKKSEFMAPRREAKKFEIVYHFKASPVGDGYFKPEILDEFIDGLIPPELTPVRLRNSKIKLDAHRIVSLYVGVPEFTEEIGITGLLRKSEMKVNSEYIRSLKPELKEFGFLRGSAKAEVQDSLPIELLVRLSIYPNEEFADTHKHPSWLISDFYDDRGLRLKVWVPEEIVKTHSLEGFLSPDDLGNYLTHQQ